MTWGWVNYLDILIWEWTNPLTLCSISLSKIVPIKATAEWLCLWATHSGDSLLNESMILNESSESMIQWPIYKDSQLPRFWMNRFNE